MAGALTAVTIAMNLLPNGMVGKAVSYTHLKDVGDIYTGNLASALESSGLFEGRFAVSSESQLYNGCLLYTSDTGCKTQ